MGVYPSQTQQKFPFNWQQIVILLSVIVFFAIMACSFLFKANTITEYAESFYVSITAFACLVNFFTSFWKTKNIYMFIENLEKFYDNRKQNSI